MSMRLRFFAGFFLAGLQFTLPDASFSAWPESPSQQIVVQSGASISEIGSVSDGAGGVIVVYHTYSPTTGRDIAARRYGADGELAWGIGTLSVCTATGDQTDVFVVPGNDGGCFVMWSDFREGQFDIYVQKITSSGQTEFSPNGSPFLAGSTAQTLEHSIADGFGGFILIYKEGVLIKALRYSPTAPTQWPGAAVVSAVSGDTVSHAIADGNGGCYVALERVGIGSEVVIVPVSPTGGTEFDQLLSLNASGNQYGLKLALQPNGNVRCVWFDGGVSPSRLVTNEFVQPLVFNPNVVLQTGTLDALSDFELISSIFGDPILLYGEITASGNRTYLGRVNAAGTLWSYGNVPSIDGLPFSHSPDNLAESPSGRIRMTYEDSTGSNRRLVVSQLNSSGLFEWATAVTPFNSSFKTTARANLVQGSQDSLIVFNSQINVPQPISFALARVRSDGSIGGEITAPDLQFSQGTLTPIRKNKKVTLFGDIVIRNDGNVATPATSVAFYASKDTIPTLGSVPLFELTVPALQPGEEVNLTPGQLPPKKPGKTPKVRKIKLPKDAKTEQYNLLIWIDPTGSVTELDDIDNFTYYGPL